MYVPPGPTYAGTAYANGEYTGTPRTLTVSVPDWRDPGDTAKVGILAGEILDSVKDGVVEGQAAYLGLFTAALTPGLALKVAGQSYSTPWAVEAIPAVECRLDWHVRPAGGTTYTTTLGLSNRRGAYSADLYVSPQPAGPTMQLDLAGDFAGGPAAGISGGFDLSAGLAMEPVGMRGVGPIDLTRTTGFDVTG